MNPSTSNATVMSAAPLCWPMIADEPRSLLVISGRFFVDAPGRATSGSKES